MSMSAEFSIPGAEAAAFVGGKAGAVVIDFIAADFRRKGIDIWIVVGAVAFKGAAS